MDGLLDVNRTISRETAQAALKSWLVLLLIPPRDIAAQASGVHTLLNRCARCHNADLVALKASCDGRSKRFIARDCLLLQRDKPHQA